MISLNEDYFAISNLISVISTRAYEISQSVGPLDMYSMGRIINILAPARKESRITEISVVNRYVLSVRRVDQGTNGY